MAECTSKNEEARAGSGAQAEAIDMPEMAKSEFWKSLKPVSPVFQPDALKDVYIGGAVTDDERYYVPFTDTVSSRPLWISPSQNKWCDILMAKGAGLVNRHYHPHEVFAYTISGKWGYLEHDWTATAGDFIYETPGESHTLVSYEHKDPMRTLFIVTGPLIWPDEDGKPDGYFDVHQYIAMCKAHYEKVGLGVDKITSLFR
jgi:2,4'-dihydroxyacetophenone dioxygenase